MAGRVCREKQYLRPLKISADLSNAVVVHNEQDSVFTTDLSRLKSGLFPEGVVPLSLLPLALLVPELAGTTAQ